MVWEWGVYVCVCVEVGGSVCVCVYVCVEVGWGVCGYEKEVKVMLNTCWLVCPTREQLLHRMYQHDLTNNTFSTCSHNTLDYTCKCDQ